MAASDDRSTYQLLTELLDDPILKDKRDFILHLMDKRAEREADLRAWHPEQIPEFEKEHESQPRSNHDLFKLACRRLQNIKDYVERDDYSPRDIFNTESPESRLRKWLANELTQRANDFYDVVQEVEVAHGKEPDIRLQTAKIHPISIEIKWVDSWTLKELEKALTTQLVGQYLRTPNSNYGVLLLGYRGKKKTWQDRETSSRLNLQQLTQHLQSLANNIQQQNENVLGLEVISVDFTAPDIYKS